MNTTSSRLSAVARAARDAGVRAPTFRPHPVKVVVPATTANLGPGFDSFGMAFDLTDEVVVQVADRGLDVDLVGHGSDSLPRDDSHLVVAAMNAAFDAMGGRPPGISLRAANRIPHGRGLGSSAAAVVAGILAARALVLGGDRRLDDAQVLALATTFEGHPDNVAACLLGGVTVAWCEDGTPATADAVRLDPHPGIEAWLWIPETELATSRARALLPALVPHTDAAFNVARAGLLVVALSSRPDLLLSATADRLHQDQREPGMPESLRLVRQLRAAGLAAVISGAGPTVLVLRDSSNSAVGQGGAGAAAEVEQRWIPPEAFGFNVRSCGVGAGATAVAFVS